MSVYRFVTAQYAKDANGMPVLVPSDAVLASDGAGSATWSVGAGGGLIPTVGTFDTSLFGTFYTDDTIGLEWDAVNGQPRVRFLTETWYSSATFCVSVLHQSESDLKSVTSANETYVSPTAYYLSTSSTDRDIIYDASPSLPVKWDSTIWSGADVEPAGYYNIQILANPTNAYATYSVTRCDPSPV